MIPNQSVEATATRQDFELCVLDIERRIVCRHRVPVAVPHLCRWMAEDARCKISANS
jgi:hypothetical protein